MLMAEDELLVRCVPKLRFVAGIALETSRTKNPSRPASSAGVAVRLFSGRILVLHGQRVETDETLLVG
jgi:hypothetical protein